MAEWIDRLTEALGRGVSWLAAAMVAVTFATVVLRYGFDVGAIALQELVVYFHGLVFLVGLSYTLKHDEHVRVDLLYSRMNPRRRDLVNLVGHLVFLLPTAAAILWVSVPYAAKSWAIMEGSQEVGGVPAVFLLKTFIPIGAGLLALQGIAESARLIVRLAAPTGEPR